MLDIQSLRTNLAAVAERLATRGVTLDTVAFLSLIHISEPTRPY